MPHKPLARSELAEVLLLARPSFEALRGARLFITGGTGFFGHWLLESLLHANQALSLGLRATVLTRNVERIWAASPHIAGDPAITLLEGDLRNFALPKEPHTHVLHAATDSSSQDGRPAYELAEAILEGTKRVLHLARSVRSCRLLYVSSGAVYGRHTTLMHTPETFLGGPDPLLLSSSYDEGKRMAEHLCVAHAHGTPLEVVFARCFAFVGPHLSLGAHFAIGNFIGAAIEGREIHIKGDGTPRRSWLYMSDLAAWLWTVLVQGAPGRAYNVGSDEAYSIAEAARLTARVLRPNREGHSALPIRIDGTPTPGAPLNSYVPSVERARNELGLRVTVPLSQAIQRTAAWHGFTP